MIKVVWKKKIKKNIFYLLFLFMHFLLTLSLPLKIKKFGSGVGFGDKLYYIFKDIREKKEVKREKSIFLDIRRL